MSPLVFGATDVYDMIFSDANCLGIDEGAKVSVELELWCDGENILDGQHNLSRYCDITLQTFYEELHWVGTPMLQENYSFVYEYPGAIPIFSGTYNISNVAFDYFYFRFLTNTRSRIVVTWNQIFNDVMLIVHIRERIHGTDNSLYWNSHVQEGEQYQIGGHQSHAARVLASDTLTTKPIVEKNDTIKDCEPVIVGMPPYTMDTTGDYKIAYVDTSCGYRIDSIVNYNYTHYVHPTTPTLSDSNITYCQRFGTPDTLRLFPEPNPALADHKDSIVAYWSTDGATFAEAEYLIPETDVIFSGPDTSLVYYVKRHDKVTSCESEVDTFKVKITPIPADPAVVNRFVEYCVGDSASALSYPAPANQRVLWGTTVDAIDNVVAPVPSTTAADTLTYYLRLQDTSTVNQCISDGYDSIIVRIFANPVVKVTADNDTLCFAETATLKAEPTNFTTYRWKQDGVVITGATDTIYKYTNNVSTQTTFTFRVDVTEAHDSVSCAAHDTINVLAYPEIGAPTLAQSKDSICGPDTVTIKVNLGTNATSVKWYNGEKNEITAAKDSLTYSIYFAKTDSVFISCVNDYGCETPDTNWLKVTVRVDTIPTVVLSADNNAEVCAQSDLIIRSTVNPVYAPLTYAWTGTGLHDPLDKDSVRFNHNVKGQYIDTLTVRDIHGCVGKDTILVTVDSLPVITLNVNYTIQDDNYCVNHNGEIIFTTPRYVKYSIDSARTWQSYPDTAFLHQPVGEYYLVVEDGNGCQNKPANKDSIRDARQPIVMTLVADTNTHCEAPFNGSISITSTTPANGAYRYRIVNPLHVTSPYQTDTVFRGLVNGLYTVLVEDTVTGCTASDTIFVPTNRILPTATFVGPDLVCYRDSTTKFKLTYPDVNTVFLFWDYVGSADSLALQLRDSATLILGGFPAGKHIFIGHYEDTLTHCRNFNSDTVRVNSVNINLVSKPDYEVCAYDTIEVYSVYYPMEPTEDTIKQWIWYNGNYVKYKHTGIYDTAIVIPSVTSNYISLIAVDNHGCNNTFGKTMGVWPLPDLTIQGELDYCQNTKTDISATAVSYPSYHYVWETATDTVKNEIRSTASVLEMNVDTADYNLHLTVTDGHGCHSDTTLNINVIKVPGAPIFTPDTQYFCDNNVTIDITHQADPRVGNFSWNGVNPTVARATGDYSAYYTNSENAVSCYSDTTKLRVVVTGAPRAEIGIKYNGDVDTTWSKARCYDPTAGDTLHIVVNPAPSASIKYVYEVNGVPSTNTIILKDTLPGTYTYQIHISDTAMYSTAKCYWDTTVNYTFKINALPTAPDNFPHSYNGGDSTIFYCQGDTAVYNFNIPAGFTATYDGGTVIPRTAKNNISLVITETATGCTNTFKYSIVEVKTPTITLASNLKDNCSDTLTGKVVATVTPAYDATYKRIYNWTPASVIPASPHEKYVNTDTVTYTFRAPNDTIVSANMTINVENAPYSASCASNDTNYIIRFQPAPTMPKFKNTHANYIDSARAAYCYDATLTTITPNDFTTSAGATVTIFGKTSIDTAGVYKVVANNNDDPKCPSDTLIFTVIRNRKIENPSLYDNYNDTIYYCQGYKPSYNFGTAASSDDSLVYLKGTTVLTAKPDTAGSYTLRIIDKASIIEPKCFVDLNFAIIEVPTPSATFAWSASWKDSNVCEGTTIDIHYSVTITPDTKFTKKESHMWSINPIVGTHSGTETAADFNFTPTDTTSVFYNYTITDTAGAGIHGIACSKTYKDSITYFFFSKPAVPLYKDTAFCAGDTIVVAESDFTFATGLELTTDVTLPDTIFTASKNIKASVHYPTFASCKSNDTIYHIVRNELPTVGITPHDTTICIGDTAKFTASGAVTYTWSTSATTESIFATDTAKYSVRGVDANGCAKTDTVKLSYHPIFTVKVAGDTSICVGASTTISAEATGGSGSGFTFHWYKDDSYSSADSGIVHTNPAPLTVTPDSSIKVNGVPVPSIYKVTVTDDGTQCTSDSSKNQVEVSAFDGARIVFRKLNSSEIIRSMRIDSTVTQSGFDMYIVDEGGCPCDSDAKIYIQFQISKNGVLLSNAELANTLDKIVGDKNTSYSFDMTGTTMYSSPFVSSYKTSEGRVPYATNISPIPGVVLDYEWLYMHFVLGASDGTGGHEGRRIRVTTGQWKDLSDGVYKFSYKVVKIYNSNPNLPPMYDFPYNVGLNIGGYEADYYTQSTEVLISDYFTFYVGNVPDDGAGEAIDVPAVVTPSVEESSVAETIDMKVYPNPANNNVNVVLEGVHGQTLITIHDMSGKAVSSMRVDVDNNGQIFNLPVDNYAQGIYFIKAVNGSAVMTKKLIIAR
jgi:hypothetical protein